MEAPFLNLLRRRPDFPVDSASRKDLKEDLDKEDEQEVEEEKEPRSQISSPEEKSSPSERKKRGEEEEEEMGERECAKDLSSDPACGGMGARG